MIEAVNGLFMIDRSFEQRFASCILEKIVPEMDRQTRYPLAEYHRLRTFLSLEISYIYTQNNPKDSEELS